MASLIVTALLFAAAVGSPFDGSWRTDLSSIQSDKPPETILLKDGVYQCTSCSPPVIIKADGKFYAVSDDPLTDHRAVEPIGRYKARVIDRRDGRRVRVSDIRVSSDGTVRTIAWLDRSNVRAPRLSGKIIQVRQGPAPMAAHPISGSWLTVRIADVTPAAMTETLKVEGGFLSMSRATGEGYRARIDGPPAPYSGNAGITDVVVTRRGPRHLVETTSYRGKVVSVMHRRISDDGRTQNLRAENAASGSVSSARSRKLKAR